MKYVGKNDEVFTRTEEILVKMVNDIDFNGFENIDEDQNSLQ